MAFDSRQNPSSASCGYMIHCMFPYVLRLSLKVCEVESPCLLLRMVLRGREYLLPAHNIWPFIPYLHVSEGLGLYQILCQTCVDSAGSCLSFRESDKGQDPGFTWRTRWNRSGWPSSCVKSFLAVADSR